MRSKRTMPQQDEHDVGVQLASTHEALMAEIATVRLKGEIRGLFEKIAELQFRITNAIFEHTVQYNRYCKLEAAMEEAQITLDTMRVYFKELKVLDPSQK